MSRTRCVDFIFHSFCFASDGNKVIDKLYQEANRIDLLWDKVKFQSDHSTCTSAMFVLDDFVGGEFCFRVICFVHFFSHKKLKHSSFLTTISFFFLVFPAAKRRAEKCARLECRYELYKLNKSICNRMRDRLCQSQSIYTQFA